MEGNPNLNEKRSNENGWDVSHNPSWNKRDLSKAKSRKEVLDNYNSGTELECRGCNRSRQDRDELRDESNNN
ncbi:MAG: GH-E family nuclease [Bacteroidota bacterium]